MTGISHIRAATRASPLARWQTDHVIDLIRAVAPSVGVSTVPVTTTGDQRAHTPIHQMGGKGVFVKEVQAAVLDGRADIAVHSAKDLPSITPEALVLAAVPERGDPRDGLVGAKLADLHRGATVGTGSVRRRAQLAGLRPDLNFAELRGNIATRLRKASQFDAIVMAVAALNRLGVVPEVLDPLPPGVLVPQAGQGAIALECRQGDHELRALLAQIEHTPTRRAVDAERAFLAELGGDCDIPAGAHAITVVPEPTEPTPASPDGPLELTGLLASIDGRVILRTTRRGIDPTSLGRDVARHLLHTENGTALIATLR